jgi:catabolite regulation protein CreA
MKIIVEELPNEMKQGKATKERQGDLTFKTHETSITWKTLSSIRTIDQEQEEVSHPGEEDP